MGSFSTARLVLRRPEDSDIEPLMAMDADPEVMRYIGTGAVRPPDPELAAQSVARWRKQWDEHGYGMCSVIVRETGEYAGWVTLAVPAFLPEILPACATNSRPRCPRPASPSPCTRSPGRKRLFSRAHPGRRPLPGHSR